MNQTSPHPDESQLRGLLRGTLGSADEAAVLARLEREPAWQATLDRLVADEATWRAAAESLQKPPLPADRTLRSVLASLASIDRSHSSINTPTTGETLDSSASDADHSRDLRFLAPSEDPVYLGKLGTYLVEEVIGRGGFGVVLKARDPKLARIVAIKVLAPHLATSGTACQRFRREALNAAAVAHEHVITIYAVDDDPLPYLVMQYIAGISLQDKLDREGPLGVKETLRIGMQTAAGLAAAHKQGLVHRDIKPANILLENGIERVKLTDFGLARAADDASLTRSGTIAGTPQYMSPEQARGETVDSRSDLFSLGTVLYAMLTGRSPFRADSTLAVLKRVCDDPPRPIREVNPDVPEWLAALIDRLLAKAPADRPASAQEVADQLGQYLLQVQQPQLDVAKTPPRSVANVAAPAGPVLAAGEISDDVRKRIDRIAYVHLFMLVLSAVGLALALMMFADTHRSMVRGARDIAFGSFVIAWVLGLSFPIPLVTALLTLRRASYWALMAGTVLTLLTAGLFNVACWPITMGLMIWVLVQLQRDDVCAALAGGSGSRGGSLPQTESTPLSGAVVGAPVPSRSRIGHATQANSALPPVRSPAGFPYSDSLALGNAPMLAKPAKLDPFVDAPPVPRRGRVATTVLGLGLLLAGLMVLSCVGITGSYLMHHRPSPEAVLENSRPLTINIPDRRLTATLRLQRADYNGGYPMSGVAIPDLNHTLQIASGETHRLMGGQYELTVKSDDVTVFSDVIHIQPDAIQPKIYEVKSGGIVNLEVQTELSPVSVDVNGHSFVKEAVQKSQRMIVVPAGSLRIKTHFSNHVFAEKWLELAAGEEITVRASRESIEVVSPAAAKPAAAATPAGSGS